MTKKSTNYVSIPSLSREVSKYAEQGMSTGIRLAHEATNISPGVDLIQSPSGKDLNPYRRVDELAAEEWDKGLAEGMRLGMKGKRELLAPKPQNEPIDALIERDVINPIAPAVLIEIDGVLVPHKTMFMAGCTPAAKRYWKKMGS